MANELLQAGQSAEVKAMIAQALGEYATMSTLVDGVRSISDYVYEVGREWGLTGALIVVASALTWKVVTRIK